MKIILESGEVFADVLANFRDSSEFRITFLSEWEWGHIIQIHGEVVRPEKLKELRFTYKPILNISNMSEASNKIEFEVKRNNE